MFVVKATSVATKNNKNFAGQTLIGYHGKDGYSFGYEGDHATTNWLMPPFFSKWNLNEYGYKRKCDAARNYTYRNPENSKHWRTTVEIVEVKDGKVVGCEG